MIFARNSFERTKGLTSILEIRHPKSYKSLTELSRKVQRMTRDLNVQIHFKATSIRVTTNFFERSDFSFWPK